MSSKFHTFGRGLGCFLLLAALLGVVYWFVIRPNLNGSASAPEARDSSEQTVSNTDSSPESSLTTPSDGKDYELVEEDGTVVSSEEIPEDDLPDNPEEPDPWQ